MCSQNSLWTKECSIVRNTLMLLTIFSCERLRNSPGLKSPLLPRLPELEIRTRKSIHCEKENVWKKWLGALTKRHFFERRNINIKHFVIFHFIDHIFILCIPEYWSLEVTEFLGIHIRFVSLCLRELTGKPNMLQSFGFYHPVLPHIQRIVRLNTLNIYLLWKQNTSRAEFIFKY